MLLFWQAGGEDLVTRVTAALASLDQRAAAREEGEPPEHAREAERDVTGASTSGDARGLPLPGLLPPPAQPAANANANMAANAGQQVGHAVSHLSAS